MTLAQMRAAVQRNLGRVGVTTTEDSDVDRIINQTIREDICADHNWSAMETTTTSETTSDGVGTKTWPSPSTFKDCEWIQVRKDSSSNYRFLDELSERAILDQFGELSTEEGLPYCWARSGTSYHLRPIPDATYTLRIKYWAYPADLTSSDSNFITLYWTKLLEYGATARGLLYYGENEAAAQWMAMYRDELGKAISVDRKIQAPATLTLKPSMVAGRPTPGIASGSAWYRRIRGNYS